MVKTFLRSVRERIIGHIPSEPRIRRLKKFFMYKVVRPIIALSILLGAIPGAILACGIHRLLFPDKTDMNNWSGTIIMLICYIVMTNLCILVTTIVWIRKFIKRRGPQRAVRYIVESRWIHNPPGICTRLILRLSGVDWHKILIYSDLYGIKSVPLKSLQHK
jgi:hypothetical protein